MKLGKKEIEKVQSTSKAQSIISSRNASRMGSRKGSRFGSMDDEEVKTSKSEQTPRTSGGKNINKLDKNDEQDDNIIEKIPDPFAAEQTEINEDDIRDAR